MKSGKRAEPPNVLNLRLPGASVFCLGTSQGTALLLLAHQHRSAQGLLVLALSFPLTLFQTPQLPSSHMVIMSDVRLPLGFAEDLAITSVRHSFLQHVSVQRPL